MKDFFVKIFQSIKIDNTIFGVIFGAFITYWFGILKMKKDRRLEYEKNIGLRISESLYEIREVEQLANAQERYDLVKDTDIPTFLESKGFYIYPAIFTNAQTISDFFMTINDARSKHEIYLSYKLSAYLLYMDRYLMELALFMKEFKEKDYPYLGLLLMLDIQKWQRDFDKAIVREINKNKLLLSSKTGWKWEFHKSRIDKKYWDGSVLKKIKDSEHTDFYKIINSVAETIM